MQKYKTVEDFLHNLDDEKRLQVDALRELIAGTQKQLTEHIKWNAPSYVLNGEDRITFNVMNKQNVVKLVLHMGATRKEDKNGTPILHDDTGLIEWSSDIRGTLTFESLEEITSNRVLLKKIIEDWLTLPAAA